MTLLGKKVGNIRVVALLGEGGMGAVYSGFDEKLERPVALKAIRADRLDAAARSRFLREARSLSQLNHPHICAIYDHLEEGESDYLVLERIEGQSLREVIDSGAPFALKLRMAEQIAEALVFAHAKGIVHRDLKPANVMWTPEGSIKVLDFGLAHLVGEPSAAAAIAEDSASAEAEALGPAPGYFRTELGRVLGTASCMSPEQGRGEEVTVASDMYSFGLLLQELFTGRPAYETDLSSPLLLVKVREGDTLPVEGLDRDLTDLIERLKALAPAARPTASEALARLRALRDKPKRRARLLAVAAALLLAVLGTLKYTLDLRRERDAARRSRREAEEVAGFLVDLFRVSDPGEARGSTITARELLDRGASDIEKKLQSDPGSQARLMDAMGQIYVKLGLYERARPLLEKAVALREKQAPRRGDLPLAISLAHLAALNQAQHREAESLYRRALAIEERTLPADDPELAITLNNLGAFYGYRGDLAQAEPLLRRALHIRETALGPEHPDVAVTLNNLAILKAYEHQPKESEALFKRGLAIREATLAADHPDLAVNLEALAVLYDQEERSAEAEALHRRALAIWEKTLGPEHPRVALIVSNLAGTLVGLGRYDEAEKLYRRAIAQREKTLGPEHPDLAFSLAGLGSLYLKLRRYDEAEPLLGRALEIEEKALKPGQPDLVNLRKDYAELLRKTGRPELARSFEKRGATGRPS
ncbi:MAG TPA: serine/threonine-protein kinase [Thermoanaerobaculia bacterium]|nr:serine/threonine-protein kinase [Thermoanaerobaculia bacterium]